MLQERRKWEYYTVYSIVTNHPLFNVEESKVLFEIFSEFAADSKLFKVRPKTIIDSLKAGGFDFDSNLFKTEVLNWMADDHPDGLAFNEFMAFMATESLGSDYSDTNLREQLTYFLSLGTKDLRLKDIEDFCTEFGCPHLKERLTKLLQSSKVDN
jgi:hypothetical protein